MAAGDFTGIDLPQIPDAQKIVEKGTELDPTSEAFKMQGTPLAGASELEEFQKEQVSQGQAATAGATEVADAAQITQDEITTVADKDVDVQATRKTAREIEDVAPGEITAGVRFATVDEVKKESR